MRKLIILIFITLLINNVFSQSIPVDSLYLGQPPPGDSAIVFAPGLISLPNRWEPCITFSPDGKSAFFYIEFWPSPKEPFVMFTEYKNGKWTTPDTASFAKNRKTGEPIFAFSGSRIYLTAKNALNQVGRMNRILKF